MAIEIRKTGGLYFEANRWRQDWEAVDTLTGEVVNRNRASFGDPRKPDPKKPPAQVLVDAAFTAILGWVGEEHAQRLNRVNQALAARLGEEWTELRPKLLAWIRTHPAATAAQARDALLAAYPTMAYDPAKFLTKLLGFFSPPFATWVEFRDYVVANASSIGEER